MKKIIAIGLLIMCVLTQVEAYQVCATDMQVTFKNNLNLVVGVTEGIKIFR